MVDDPDEVLLELLDGNRAHVENLPENYFEALRSAQHPAVVTICCSDSRVSQEGMWNTDRPGEIFTPSNIGNQAWDEHEGDRIVDGSLLYPIHYAGTSAVAVVGHTGCGAVTAAYRVVTEGTRPEPVGVAKWVDLLVPVVEDGLESDLIDSEAAESRVIDQLVEYNVDYQARFLRDSTDVPDEVAVYGFVYDFHGVYGNETGRAYLVNLEGETRPAAIANRLPEQHREVTASLLY